MTCAVDTLEAVLTTRSFRAIGTTAIVVVQDAVVADTPSASWPPSSRRSTWPAAGSAPTPSSRRCTPKPAGPSPSADSSSTRSRSRSARRSEPAAPSTRRSAMRSPRSATTPTWTRCWLGHPRRPRRSAPSRATPTCSSIPATGPSASLAASGSIWARPPRRSPPTGRRPGSRRIGAGVLVSLGRRRGRRRAAPRRRVGHRHRPRVGDAGRARSTRWWRSRTGAWPAPPPPSGPGARASVRSTTSWIPARGTAWTLLGPGLRHRRQLCRRQRRHHRRHRVGRAGPGQARRDSSSRCGSSAATEGCSV